MYASAVQNHNSPYFGGIVGRVANRIANGTFVVDGQRYTLDKNDHGNTLHGGFNPFFENNTWTIEEASDKEVRLSLFSPDGTQVLPDPVLTASSAVFLPLLSSAVVVSILLTLALPVLVPSSVCVCVGISHACKAAKKDTCW